MSKAILVLDMPGQIFVPPDVLLTGFHLNLCAYVHAPAYLSGQMIILFVE